MNENPGGMKPSQSEKVVIATAIILSVPLREPAQALAMTDSIQSLEDSSTVQQPTALAKALSVPLTEHRGAKTPDVFSSTPEELTALLSSAGVYDLGRKAFLRCAGRDRVRWLNGMVTNSVKDLAENAGCYAFVLNAQGRIQGDLNIYRRANDPEALWLQTDCSQLDALTKFVRRYIIMDQVTLDIAYQWTAIGVAGPGAKEMLAALSLNTAEPPSLQVTEATWQGHSVAVVSANSPCIPKYEIWIESHAVLDLWNALTRAGATPCGANAIEQLRILEGTPAYGIDIVDRDLPQETNQMRALNFNKGCYLGQEIVERIRSRGSVHRTFSGFTLEGNPPSMKTPVMAGEKSVGELTSTARIDIPQTGERALALGFIRREALESKEILTAAGIVVTPVALPFDFTRTAVQP
jgi:folate-binding protein YgfZ